MDWYTVAPVVAGIVIAWIAWDVPRAAIWVVLLLASFAVSTLWWNLDGPYPAAFGAATDLIIALITLRHARNQWEFYVVDCYGFMILVDALWLFGAIPSHYLYAISLEAANWLVLLLIGAVGLMQRNVTDRLHTRHGRPGLVAVGHRFFSRAKTYPRWWRHRE